MGRVTARRRITRLAGGRRDERMDTLVVEEPLEIRVGGRALAVTMRTPGHDVDLALGFCVSEGIVRTREDVVTARYCAGATEDGVNTYNVLDIALAPGVEPPNPSLERAFYTTSSCGLCGKASLDAVRTSTVYPVADDPVVLDPTVLASLPDQLRAAQPVFSRTGGLHAAALFHADGTLVVSREDVGRHNAVDKVVGHLLREGRIPARGGVLMVSGRASFELAQKSVMAGIPALAAVSAPSSLAVELAEQEGLTLVGFLRGDRMNIYAGAARLPGPVAATAASR